MTNVSTSRAVAASERAERNQLFAEFEQEATRVSWECSEQPYGDLPSTDNNLSANLLTVLPNLKLRPEQEKIRDGYMPTLRKIRPQGVGALSIHSYMFNEQLEYATFYERREKGTGFYWRLRTVKECQDQPEPAIIIADYAIKSVAPNRSINWLVATRAMNDGYLLHRNDKRQPSSSLEWSYKSWKGTDLLPKSFSPLQAADYERVKLRLLEAITVLGKMNRANIVYDLAYAPPAIAKHLESPVTYQYLGSRF